MIIVIVTADSLDCFGGHGLSEVAQNGAAPTATQE
jgi:hypothetical protein